MPSPQEIANLAAMLKVGGGSPDALLDAPSDPRRDALMAARAQVGAGPYGLPSLPPLPTRPQGEMRNANQFPAVSDYVAQKTSSPMAGVLLDKGIDLTSKLGQATGDTVGALTGANLLPWAVERGAALGKSAAEALPDGISLTSTAEAQSPSKPSNDVRDLQTKLKALGYYKGKVDGRTGDETDKAREKYEADQATKRQQDIDLAKTQADRDAALARQKEADAKLAADATAAKQREEGGQRLREVDDSIPIWRRILRDNAPMIGYLTGGLGGHLLRGAVTRFGDRVATEQAARADKLITDAKGADWPPRAAAVNQFWAEGQPRPLTGGAPEIPFTSRAGETPPFAANPDAPSSASLYPAPRLSNTLQDVGVAGAGLGESAAAHFLLSNPANVELAKARDAANFDPSEVNIRRLQSAEDASAFAHGLENLGRGTAIGYVGSMPMIRRDQERPNVSAAEAERMRIDQYLSRGQRGTGPQPQPGTPQPGAESMPNGRSGAGPQEAATLGQLLKGNGQQDPASILPGGSHPDHEWIAKANRWQYKGRFIKGEPPKEED